MGAAGLPPKEWVMSAQVVTVKCGSFTLDVDVSTDLSGSSGLAETRATIAVARRKDGSLLSGFDFAKYVSAEDVSAICAMAIEKARAKCR